MLIDLHKYNINIKKIYRNASVAELYEFGMEDKGCILSNNGALVAYSNEKTGRSPKDKRVVENPETKDDIWWSQINIPISPQSYDKLKELAIQYFNKCNKIYVFDGFAGNDANRIKIRIVCTRPYHALFMHNMLVRPTKKELEEFGDPDYIIYNAGKAPADPAIEGVDTRTSVALCFEKKEIVILGSEYAGEMKKGVFTIMNYLLPKKGILSMHCSANEGKDGDVTLFFGLSGTGKTTLSADPNRKLIGDDEHYWTEEGVFNIEGGCYAKCIDLSREQEPDIYDAIRFGSIMENVVLNSLTRNPDYSDSYYTENTRAAYPVEFINNAKIPGKGPAPKNIVFLVCDAFGIIPPVSKLSSDEAAYWFISGYTAKVAGTEVGIKSPQASFSACFGAPFLVWHPNKYGTLLTQKIQETGSQAWLVNTGWVGGGYGVGSRIKLKYTRKIIDGIHSGELAQTECNNLPIFNLKYPVKCEGVPDEVLCPYKSWSSRKEYDQKTMELAKLFIENFEKYQDHVDKNIKKINPVI